MTDVTEEEQIEGNWVLTDWAADIRKQAVMCRAFVCGVDEGFIFGPDKEILRQQLDLNFPDWSWDGVRVDIPSF